MEEDDDEKDNEENDGEEKEDNDDDDDDEDEDEDVNDDEEENDEDDEDEKDDDEVEEDAEEMMMMMMMMMMMTIWVYGGSTLANTTDRTREESIPQNPSSPSLAKQKKMLTPPTMQKSIEMGISAPNTAKADGTPAGTTQHSWILQNP